jgi:hypothetical protein
MKIGVMKLLLLLFGLSILLSNCSHYNCPATVETNKENFKKYLNIIKSREVDGKTTFVDEYREALNFLSLVTGIDSKADYSSTFGYRDKTDYKNDMKQWKKWYKENQCKITEQYVDSVYKRVGLKR